jgi:hypothetical protein
MTKTIAFLLSIALVSPFAVLELLNNGLHSGRALDYVLLFGLLWAPSLAFLVTATQVLRGLRSGRPVWRSPVVFSVKLAILVLVAVAWIGIVNDQLPCFMGSVNCD